MNSDNSPSLIGSFLSGIRGIFKGDVALATPTSTPIEFEAIRREFNTALKSLKEKADSRRMLQSTTSQISTVNSSDRVLRTEDQKVLLKRAFEDAKSSMRREIEELHIKLKSGVEKSEIAYLRDYLLNVSELISLHGSSDIDARLRSAAILAIFKRAGEISWDKLNQLMQAAGDEWPDSHSLIDGATESECALEKERTVNDVRDTFLSSTPQAIAELTIGVVQAWSLSYPPHGSWLWKQVALRGVGAGIYAKIVRDSTEAIKSEGSAIRQEISTMLADEIASINKSIEKAGSSIEEMDEMVRSAGQALEGVVIDLVLERAKPIFQRFATY